MNPINPNYAETIFRQLLRLIDEYNSAQRALREGELSRVTGLSPSTIRNRCTFGHPSYDPEFPQPVVLSSGKSRAAIGWLFTDVVRWLNSRPTALLQHQVNKRPHNSNRAHSKDDL
jgi:predicted DNA-binding transcriptional regulator AlpA